MSRIYCSLSDTKRLLRSLSNKESRIRFSSSYRDLKRDSDNSGSIRLTGVNFESSFADHDTFTFEFTDSTSFDVSSDITGYLGSGNRLETFSAEERFSVSSENWTGSALSGDKCYITSASDISDDDGHQFIVDATKRINSRLEKVYGTLSSVSFYDSTSVEIPQAISFSCSRYSAYFIFTSVFSGMSSDEKSPVENWKIEADETLGEYISSHGVGPRWRSRPIRITEIGVEGIGDGPIEIGELTDPKNKEYTR